MSQLLVIIPAYNEENTIAQLLTQVLDINLDSLGIEKKILVVDDGSTDRTPEIVEKNFSQVELLSNIFRQGKGSAIRKALEYSDADIAIIQDADLEYDPKEYPKLLEPIVKGEAEVVYGSRFLGRRYPSGMQFLNFLGNRLGIWLVNLLYGASITDLMTGYKAFSGRLINKLSLKSQGFDICPEITAKLLNKDVKIYEVPISYQGRSLRQGKKIAIIDSLFILLALLRYKFWN